MPKIEQLHQGMRDIYILLKIHTVAFFLGLPRPRFGGLASTVSGCFAFPDVLRVDLFPGTALLSDCFAFFETVSASSSAFLFLVEVIGRGNTVSNVIEWYRKGLNVIEIIGRSQ